MVFIILDHKFLNDCLIVVKLMAPLVCLLRIVDCDERSSTGYAYEGMYKAHFGIKKLFNHNKRLYKFCINIIKQRWDEQLYKSIHSTTYWLNPCSNMIKKTFVISLKSLKVSWTVLIKKSSKAKTKI